MGDAVGNTAKNAADTVHTLVSHDNETRLQPLGFLDQGDPWLAACRGKSDFTVLRHSGKIQCNCPSRPFGCIGVGINPCLAPAAEDFRPITIESSNHMEPCTECARQPVRSQRCAFCCPAAVDPDDNYFLTHLCLSADPLGPRDI